MNRTRSAHSGALTRSRLSAVELLQIKLQQARRRQAWEAFFALRNIPALAVRAGLLAVIDMVAGALIPPGVTLTLFFGGSALLVVWLGRRARLTID